MIPESLVPFLESGISVLVGAASGPMPSCARAVGASVSSDRKRLSILLPEAACKDALADMEKSKRAAVMFSRAVDHYSLQLKGRVSVLRKGTDADLERAIAYRQGFAQMLATLGLPRSITERIAIEPLWVAELEVEEIFRQTPGPAAGERL